MLSSIKITHSKRKINCVFYFLARDSMLRAHMPSAARLSLRLSVSRVDQSKKVEVRIMQLSPQVAP